jgi:hypothetical protein
VELEALVDHPHGVGDPVVQLAAYDPALVGPDARLGLAAAGALVLNLVCH